MFSIATGGNEENPFALTIGDGQSTQCSAGYNYCYTLHCARLWGMRGFKKNCAKLRHTNMRLFIFMSEYNQFSWTDILIRQLALNIFSAIFKISLFN
jgi:hypothetical protein